jgi:single-strand DNA-binding protein
MANEPTTTITGNLAGDPEIRFTATGRPVASFTIANTPRFPDKTTGVWQDGETWFCRCSAWGDLAQNITDSLTKGAAVVATGRLRSRSWETDDGSKRYVVELTVDDIGPSLRRATVKVTKTTRDHATGSTTPPVADDPWAPPATTARAPAGAGGFSDDPPF